MQKIATSARFFFLFLASSTGGQSTEEGERKKEDARNEAKGKPKKKGKESDRRGFYRVVPSFPRPVGGVCPPQRPPHTNALHTHTSANQKKMISEPQHTHTLTHSHTHTHATANQVLSLWRLTQFTTLDVLRISVDECVRARVPVANNISPKKKHTKEMKRLGYRRRVAMMN